MSSVNIYQSISYIFFTDIWGVLTTPGVPTYHPFWAPLLVGGTIIELSLLSACCWLIILFFSKKNIFPTAFIVISFSFPVWVVVESALYTIVTDDPIFDAETLSAITNSIGAACPLIYYLLRSKRVKATFEPLSWLVALKLEETAEAKAKAKAKSEAKSDVMTKKELFISIAGIMAILLGGVYSYLS